jgi:fatty-acyl-CoA synthase
VTGYIPVGYYKDEEKTKKTFREFEGKRWSVPGDFAAVESDGSLRLLGRGSVCINTGGEKVFPEEVEEVLKQHPSVRDAVCVAVPDERFGEAITAIVEAQDGAVVDENEVIDHVKERLARFKAPKHVLTVETIGRSPAGKVDYKGLTKLARDKLGV